MTVPSGQKKTCNRSGKRARSHARPRSLSLGYDLITGSIPDILQTVTVGSNPLTMAFDGTNIWVPNYGSNTISVVRAVGGLSGTVIATLSGNGIANPSAIAFDGERMLVTNENAQSISLFRAADLAPLASVPLNIPENPFFPVGACSDGLNFWITFRITDKLARF